MRAFVLSGGANYGAQQVGALEVLFERGLIPELLVGVSAGALNAAWVAANPTLNGVHELARIWREDAPGIAPPVGPLAALLRVIGGRDSLLSNDSLQQFIRRWPFAEDTFSVLTGPRLYTVAACYTDGTLRLFGDDPADRIFDGLMTSTAMPPFYPPWEVDGVLYLDGGITSHLPVQAAVERGATEIFALRNGHGFTLEAAPAQRNVFTIGGQAISLLVESQANREIEVVRHNRSVQLHLIELYADDDPGLWNFSRAAELIAAGRRLTEEYLTSRGMI
jgi:NTE family protein